MTDWRKIVEAQASRKREANFGHDGKPQCFCEHCVSVRNDTVCNCVICQRARREELKGCLPDLELRHAALPRHAVRVMEEGGWSVLVKVRGAGWRALFTPRNKGGIITDEATARLLWDFALADPAFEAARLVRTFCEATLDRTTTTPPAPDGEPTP